VPVEGDAHAGGGRGVVRVPEPESDSGRGANDGEECADRLGFNEHGYPAQANWYRVLRLVDVAVLEEKVRRWMEEVLRPDEGERLGLSIDGKTLRVSRKMGASNSHLLSAVVHGLGAVVGQWVVDDHTNEIGQMKPLLLDLALAQQRADGYLDYYHTRRPHGPGDENSCPIRHGVAFALKHCVLFLDSVPGVAQTGHHV
jgi:hypothetical protein